MFHEGREVLWTLGCSWEYQSMGLWQAAALFGNKQGSLARLDDGSEQRAVTLLAGTFSHLYTILL